MIEAALRENEWLKYVGKELSDLVDCAYLITVAQGARLIREGDEASQSFILEGKKIEKLDNARNKCFDLQWLKLPIKQPVSHPHLTITKASLKRSVLRVGSQTANYFIPKLWGSNKELAIFFTL